MNRKSELSVLNVVFCLIVIFIHIASAPVTRLSKESVEYAMIFVPWRLSSFVVQGFIFLSGVKMFLGRKTGYAKYYIQRVKRVVLPYILAVILFYLYFLLRNYYKFSIPDILGYILKGNLVSHFYFVIIIIQFYALRPLWEMMTRYVKASIAIPLSIVIMFWCKNNIAGIISGITGSEFIYNDRIFTTYLAYWVFGCYAYKNYEQFKGFLIKHRRLIICEFSVVALIEAIVSYLQFTSGGMMLLEELHFIYSASAILAVMSFALATGEVKNGLFNRIDNASYHIYLIHPIFIFLTDSLLEGAGIYDIFAAFIIRAIVTYTASIMLCSSYLEFKKRTGK